MRRRDFYKCAIGTVIAEIPLHSRGNSPHPPNQQRPTFCRVTLLTTWAKLPVMDITLPVAIDTASTHSGNCLPGWSHLAVALHTGDPEVFTGQGVVCLAAMVEYPSLPVPRAVATVTFSPKRRFMDIILAVALHASSPDILEPLRAVTSLTFGHTVPTRQREGRLVVVKNR
jgi:hypothetical protein